MMATSVSEALLTWVPKYALLSERADDTRGRGGDFLWYARKEERRKSGRCSRGEKEGYARANLCDRDACV